MSESPQNNSDTMPAVGQHCTLSIDDLAFGGEGVGRLGDLVVFVPFVVPGEQVEVEITELKKRFARARLLKIVIASPDRVEPRCRFFGECGGCQYQHIAYPRQLAQKRKQIADLLQRVGGRDAAVVEPVIPCPQLYNYRNRIMVRSQWNKPEQKLNIGFLGHDNRLVVDIDECLIAEPALNEQLAQVHVQPPPKGGIKVTLRIPPENWELPGDSFFQTNFFLLPKLAAAVRDCVAEGGARWLVDAYCGVGFFSIECADLVTEFLGIDVDLQAIRSARLNAQRRGISNGEYLAGRTEFLLPDLLRKFEAGTTVFVLDPPRTGCPPQSLELLKSARPRQIIYVSCHPATLARDLNLLCQDGVYALARIRPLDMFPHTQHVECVADLRLASFG